MTKKQPAVFTTIEDNPDLFHKDELNSLKDMCTVESYVREHMEIDKKVLESKELTTYAKKDDNWIHMAHAAFHILLNMSRRIAGGNVLHTYPIGMVQMTAEALAYDSDNESIRILSEASYEDILSVMEWYPIFDRGMHTHKHAAYRTTVKMPTGEYAVTKHPSIGGVVAYRVSFYTQILHTELRIDRKKIEYWTHKTRKLANDQDSGIRFGPGKNRQLPRIITKHQRIMGILTAKSQGYLPASIPGAELIFFDDGHRSVTMKGALDVYDMLWGMSCCPSTLRFPH